MLLRQSNLGGHSVVCVVCVRLHLYSGLSLCEMLDTVISIRAAHVSVD